MSSVAVITGASSGLGIEFAKRFAHDGIDIVLVARSEDKLKRLAKKIKAYYGVNTYVLVQDLSEKDAALNVKKYTDEQGLNVSYLVNNAGFGDVGEFIDCDWDKQYRMVNVNIQALMQLCKVYLPDMKDNGFGRILNIASAAAFGPGPNMSVYYASKAFVKSFSEAISEEVKRFGIGVTALCLGPADTGFWDAAGFDAKDLLKRIGMANAKDVARVGYEGMMKKKALALFGISTKALNVGSRLAPSALIRKVVYKVNS